MKAYPVKFDGIEYETLGTDEDRMEYIRENPEKDQKYIGIIEVGKFATLNCVDCVILVTFDEYADPPVYDTIYSFGKLGWADWLSDHAPTPERKEALEKATERLGKFATYYGWSPRTVIENAPDQAVLKGFIEYELLQMEKGLQNGD